MSANGSGWEDEADRMVRGLGAIDPRVAAAMRRVPRHRFVSAGLRRDAYADEPLPLGRGAPTISAPHMVAYQLEWAELRPGLAVLEVGSGSGYLAALLAELVAPGGLVDAVEVEPELVERSSALLRSLGYGERIRVHLADGRLGWPAAAPFDRIVVSAASPEFAAAWRDQLAERGILIAPLGTRFEQRMVKLSRTSGKERIEEGPAVRFVSLRPAEPPYI